MKVENTSKIVVQNQRSSCPVSTVLEIIGDHWSLILIRDLFFTKDNFFRF